MLGILALVAPLFSLILAGWVTLRSGYMGRESTRVLAEFGYKVATPALLFRTLGTAGDFRTSPFRLLGAYLCAILTVWILATIASRLILRRPTQDGAAIAMGSCFGNGVMLGIPLFLSVFGAEAAAPLALLLSLEAPLLWTLGTLHMAVVRQGRSHGVGPAFIGIVNDLVRNPVLLSIIAGALWRQTGLPIPFVPDQILVLLGQSAVPVSLFALGMALAMYEVKGEAPTVTVICVLKLFVYPALAFYLAINVFDVPASVAAVFLIYTCMPVGANAFLFATRYERAIGPVSAALAISTIIAIATLTIVLALLKSHGFDIRG
jgi:predicted permease